MPAAEWEDLGDGLFRTDWAYDWGNHAAQWETPKVLGHRAEMVFVDGQLMDQVLIEAYDYSISGELMDHGNRKQQWEYRGFTDPTEHPEVMPPGTFGVAERDDSGNKLYLRLPGGTSIDDALIEVSTRRQLVRFAGGDWSAPGKNNLDIEDLVSVLNYQTGLDLELAQGPFTVKRALLAGNRSYEFTMSIVGEFVLEDSILYDSNSPPQAKLKKERVPHAAVNLQWYVRNDEHAKQRPMDPKQFGSATA